MTITGPDVSHHQGTVDMKAVHDQGHHDMVGIKASEGSTYLDPMFRTNRTHAAAAGLIRLLYHFGRPGPTHTDADARAEANWFVRMIGTLDPGEVAVLDLEDDKVPAGVDLTGWMLTFLATVDQLTGRAGGTVDDDAALYTYGPYARGHIRLRSTDRHLWLAAYSSSPSVPPPWKAWTFWQYTSSGACPGIAGRCDLNRFTGPFDALQRIAGIRAVEDDMYGDKDRERDELMAEQVQQIHDALYKGDVKFGVFPGMEGMTRDIYKKVTQAD